jgi:hypothetical protein
LQLTLLLADDSIAGDSGFTGRARMNKRCISILLTLLIGISGLLAYPAYASNCTARASCASVRNTGHSAGGGNHPCTCFLWHSRLANRSCRLASLLQTSRQRFLPPTFTHIQLSGLGLVVSCRDRLPTLNRMGPAHRWDSTVPPLSVPIYLQTSALLC